MGCVRVPLAFIETGSPRVGESGVRTTARHEGNAPDGERGTAKCWIQFYCSVSMSFISSTGFPPGYFFVLFYLLYFAPLVLTFISLLSFSFLLSLLPHINIFPLFFSFISLFSFLVVLIF